MDMIDETLLRPGRLEVHMEISLPDESGRHQILEIHMRKMRQENLIDPDVQIDELVSRTKNFSGAEIAGLVKSATSFAFNRHVKVCPHFTNRMPSFLNQQAIGWNCRGDLRGL